MQRGSERESGHKNYAQTTADGNLEQQAQALMKSRLPT